MTNATDARHRRAFLLTGISAFALAGCGDIVGPPEAAQIYVMRPDFPAPATPPAKLAWSLAIERPSTSAALNGDRIAILKPDATMDYYASSQYPDSLPSLVETALLNGFEKNGALAGVARSAEALHADYNLFTDIKDFQARYSVADGVPDAVVTLTARLATSHGRNMVGSITVSQTVSAGTNNVGAAAAALQQALAAAVSGVVTWALTFPAPPSATAPG